jgi:outer membrane protein insertion porin family
MGFPLTEYWTFGSRYTLSQDKVSLDQSTFYTNGACDPLKAGRYLCDEIGTRLTSLVGVSTLYDNTDGIHPTRGQRMSFSEDFAGLGGDVRYLRTRADATKYKGFGGGWIFSVHAEGGFIKALQSSPGPGRDAVRLTDRFFGPDLRGFDIRGIGPRIQRQNYKCADATCTTAALDTTAKAQITDALGGKAYYMGRLELEFPTSSGLKSLGLRPSAFIDIGSLFSMTQPILTDVRKVCTATDLPVKTIPGTATNMSCTQFNTGTVTGYADTAAQASAGFKEFFVGNSPRPRLSIGVGVNWTSPFGPLRLDLAKAILTQKGDETKLFSFNVGTQF